MPEAPTLKPHTLGGQAVIGGVMMRSPAWWAIAVRRPDGGIHRESHPVGSYARKRPILGKALLRGVLALGEAMSIGVRALSIGARYSSGEEGEELTPRQITVTLIVAFVFFIGVFIVIPAVVVRGGPSRGSGAVARNLIEGLVRIAILVGYILAISMLQDVRRVFQYHGAEHKVIAAFEAGRPRTAEGARPFSTIHVRCGTNFLFLVMILAVVVFSFVGRSPLWWRVASRIVLLPVVAAFSYEVLRLAARHERNPLIRLITLPGLLLQRITTREPDPDQLEIALASLDELLTREQPESPPPAPDAA